MPPSAPASGPAADPGRGRAAVPEMPAMPTVVIRSLRGRIGTVCVVAVVALLGGMSLVSHGPRAALAPAGWGGLVCLAAWALWWAPSLVLSQEALTVHNAWHSHVVSWEALAELRTRWSLVLLLRGGQQVPVSAAQRPGGLAQSTSRYLELREVEARARGRRAGIGGGRRSEGAGSPGDGLLAGLVGRGVREELLEPGEGTYRTGANADTAADLIEAYRERRAAHLAILARDRHRAERLRRNRRESPGRPQEPQARPRAARAQEADAVDEALVSSRLRRAPVVAAAVLGALVLASLM